MADNWLAGLEKENFAGGEIYWAKQRQRANERRTKRLKGSFDQQLKEFLETLADRTITAKQALAVQIASYIVDISPVWTGAYVKSHQVGVNSVDATFTAPTISTTANMPIQSQAVKALRQERKKINSAKINAATRLFDEIYISNSAPHASIVEYIGWQKTGPYHVYSKAKMKAKAIAPVVTKGSGF